MIITTNFWQKADFATPPARSLDDYIKQNYRLERIYQLPGQAEAYRLLVRGVER